ncbi:class I SAM-dependent methyltransferase [Maritimibacter alkaliphilus]|uniref:class I SAM-dependent methyltransferase n=1 Tax=Maritimibacter alkaliphilus TaxID=404236 RepID=UPI001C979141|nr:class I SAM-dependent methyltransferase [Maritimibacter alkaliphilus]MBY6089209.1 class I SAM-dependent methyltransferase [Maritimibacter alkaliphilus]
MSDWSRGYPVDTAYFDTMQPEISPFRWRPALLTARFAPPSARRFRFLELGCGSAHTLIALAACYPEAEFLGIDFMPEHVVRARALISEIGLSNIRVEEAGFADLAATPPEAPYDYAAMHGVWSWVDPETRATIVELLGRWLAPGALCYNGYNCAAGWAAAAPIRQIFREAPAGPAEDRYGPARAAVADWLSYSQTPALEAFWAQLSRQSDGFLAHELGAKHGAEVWVSDLVRDMAPAKMAFACPCELHEQFDALFLDGARLDFIRAGTAQGWTQTARDLAYVRTFRADLFHRGALRLTTREMIEALRALPVIGWDRERGFGLISDLPVKDTPVATPEITAQIAALSQDGPHPIGTLVDGLDLDAQHGLQAVLVQLIRGNLLVVRPPEEAAAAQDGARAFNAVAKHHLEAGRNLLPGLASAQTGGVVIVPKALQRVGFGLDTGTPEQLDWLGQIGLTAQASPT